MIDTGVEGLGRTFTGSRRQPFVCMSVFLDILESLDNRFGLSYSLLVEVDNDVSPFTIAEVLESSPLHLPARQSFKAKLATRLLKEKVELPIISKLLSKGSPPVVISALEFMQSPAGETLSSDLGVRQCVLAVASNSKFSVTVRLPALQLLANGKVKITSSDWPFESIFSEYEAIAVCPVRDLLLVVAARNIVNSKLKGEVIPDVWTAGLLDGLLEASSERKSVETRLAAATALVVLLDIHHVMVIGNALKVLDVSMMLVQDDDDDVRFLLVHGLARLPGGPLGGTPKVSLAAFECLATCAHRLSNKFLVDRILDDSAIQADVDRLLNPSKLLFATERANLYRDDLEEFRFLQELAEKERAEDSGQTLDSSDHHSKTFTELLSLLTSEKFNHPGSFLDASPDNDLISQRAWDVLAHRVIAASSILQSFYHYRLNEQESSQLSSLRKRLILA